MTPAQERSIRSALKAVYNAAQSGNPADIGAPQAALDRLCELGLLFSWEANGGRFYKVTDEGKAAMRG